MGDISAGSTRQNGLINIQAARALDVGADRAIAFKEYVRPNGFAGLGQSPLELAAAAAAAAAASPQLLLAQLAGASPGAALGATGVNGLSSQVLLQQLQQQAFAQAYANSLAQLQRPDPASFLPVAAELHPSASAPLPIVLSGLPGAASYAFGPSAPASFAQAGAPTFSAPLPYAGTGSLPFQNQATIPFETPALISIATEAQRDVKGSDARVASDTSKRENSVHQADIGCQASASSATSSYHSDGNECDSRSGCNDKPEDTMEVVSVTKTEKACQAAFDGAEDSGQTNKGCKRKATSTSDDGGDSKGGNSKESKSGKKARLIWTPELHARFLNAVNHLGVKNAVPKTILQLMNVEGMTRENVASHLQKYRLYLKRLAGLPSNAPLSAETLQTVQNVQQAMQQQVQAGLQQQGAAAAAAAAAAALPLGPTSASPLASVNGALACLNLPHAGQISVTNNYDVLVNQLSAMNAASNTHNLSAAAAAANLQASAISAMQRSAVGLAGGPHSLPASANVIGGPGMNGLNGLGLGGLGALAPLNGVGLGNLGNGLSGLNTLTGATTMSNLNGLNGLLPVGLVPPISIGGFGGVPPNVLGQVLSSLNGNTGLMFSNGSATGYHSLPTTSSQNLL